MCMTFLIEEFVCRDVYTVRSIPKLIVIHDNVADL